MVDQQQNGVSANADTSAGADVNTNATAFPTPGISTSDCNIEDFKALTRTVTTEESVALADDIEKQIPVYNGLKLAGHSDDPAYTSALMAEWNQVFDTGPGVVLIKAAYPDPRVVQDATRVLQQIIAKEAAAKDTAGDHFAPAGANSRVWNAHEKLAVADPDVFANYYANPVLHLASRAWLGPGYQITAQVNVVHPGGRAQVCHRDYHLGFQGVEQLSAYPQNVHRLSPHLTLQGAIAHTPMPVASGPTQLLPYSQKYLPGYMATQLGGFREYFEHNHVQLALDTGDMVFFNPAVFHAAGNNNTSEDRFANLLQVGSAFGRTTELVDRSRLCRLLYPVLFNAQLNGTFCPRQIRDVIAATAEGYAFPCNLDLTPPVDGLAPKNQQQIMQHALQANTSIDDFNAVIDRWESTQHS